MKFYATKALSIAGGIGGAHVGARADESGSKVKGVVGGAYGGAILGGAAGILSDFKIKNIAEKRFNIKDLPPEIQKTLANKEFLRQYSKALPREKGTMVLSDKNVLTKNPVTNKANNVFKNLKNIAKRKELKLLRKYV